MGNYEEEEKSELDMEDPLNDDKKSDLEDEHQLDENFDYLHIREEQEEEYYEEDESQS